MGICDSSDSVTHAELEQHPATSASSDESVRAVKKVMLSESSERGDDEYKNTSADPRYTERLLERIGKLPISDAREKISAIASNSSASHLSLPNRSIGDAGATAIGEGLCNNDTLLSLNLLWNKISDAGAVAIGEGLSNNATLQALDLWKNQISDAGAVVIAEGLSNNATLRTLNLNDNQISDAGAVAIAEGLSNNATLQTLDLSENEISDAGAVAIAEGLSNNATLQTLRIHMNPMTHIGVLALAKAFRWTGNLQELSAAPKGSGYGKVNAQKEIGHGEFGSVFLGMYEGNEVVEKRSHTTSNREEIYEQLILLGLPQHPNVVRLPVLSYVGINSLILEAHKGGSLKNYARNHEDGVPLITFLGYSHDMCVAIKHLHKHGIIHRDIALRNYVLTQDLLRAILIDFGLSWPIEEEKYVALRGEKMPFRQCAPEVLSTLQYSKAADIWQLGLAMWQLLHRGQQPFSPYINGQELVQFLNKKMGEDKRCVPLSFRKYHATQLLMDTVKEIVVFCCQYEPAERPTATQLVEKIEFMHESLGAHVEESLEVQSGEEKEVTQYVPDEGDVESGLNQYNYTDYGSFKTGGHSVYIDLKKDVEEHQHDEFGGFPEVDLEQVEEDLENQYQYEETS